ncbi:hypothetical protein M0651_08445 [Paenibacillus sp. MBLB2552]|uniref:Uncharacterized protein n=1 Tax=Paenibacillus mellifer TaxID=2937794 RepID=A0A9X1Y072_9BACL|nr:hypothetical protein [Paenibacillus mellifer]MCK8487196.1 hypothetical protein [Paenibacillus mellifer]
MRTIAPGSGSTPYTAASAVTANRLPISSQPASRARRPYKVLTANTAIPAPNTPRNTQSRMASIVD